MKSIEKPLDKVTVFTDGSCLGNPGPGGWAAILDYKGHRKEIGKPFAGNTTNNQMELMAVVMAIWAVNKKPCEITLVVDSTYVANGIASLDRWLSKPELTNEKLWKAYKKVVETRKHVVKVQVVKGHGTSRENRRCDAMARGHAKEARATMLGVR